jgi:hypothetical protein
MGGKVSMGGRASTDGSTTLDKEWESAVASELCRLRLLEGNKEAEMGADAARACRGRRVGRWDVESLSSIDRAKSTDPFRLRKGRLPDGDDDALSEAMGERCEVAAWMAGAIILLLFPVVDADPLEAVENSNELARGLSLWSSLVALVSSE